MWRLLLLLLIFSPVLADEKLEAFFSEYCYKCHDEDVQKGDLRLDLVVATPDPVADRKIWLAILEQLETREMPPKDPLPTGHEYRAATEWVAEIANSIDWEALKHPGHVTLPRLTKAEYNNTIRDLFGLDSQPGRTLAPDAEGRTGFTNDRDNLFLTATELEKYLESAEIAVEALRSFEVEKISQHWEAEEMFMTETRTKPATFIDDSVGHVLSSGQKTLYTSIEIPAYGFYRFSIRAGSTNWSPATTLLRIDDSLVGELRVRNMEREVVSVEGFMTPGVHQLTLNGELPPVAKKEKGKKSKPDYTVVPENANEIVGRDSVVNSPEYPMPEAPSKELRTLILDWNRNEKGVQRAYEWLRLHGEKGDPAELRRFKRYVVDRSQPLKEIGPKIAQELGISFSEFEASYARMNAEKIAAREVLMLLENTDVVIRRGFPGVDWVEIEGPVMPANSDPAIATAATAAVREGENWSEWFSDFVSRAFRMPVTEAEVAKYLALYETSVAEGASHADAASQVVVAVLASPRFLYRSEELPNESGDKESELTDYQLASRLSYFIWQTCPDVELREAVAAGELSSGKGMQQLLTRMLKDEKARELFSTFPGQWLGYEALGESVIPDGRLFPEFDRDLSESMKEETRMLFARVFRENLSLLDLVDSDATYLNQRLANHYGIGGVGDDVLRLVSLEGEALTKRGGLLGMASVLTATSTPVRTSPVLRGVWVMERLLGEEPGNPPADAGELAGNAGSRGKTLREELEIHRDREDCAGCHDKIDPLGFGLEGFDALGRWREDAKIDTSGELPDGTKFTGVDGLRKYLVEERADDFAQVVVEKLLSFALGRELQFYDEPVVNGILSKTKPDGFRARAVVEAIVSSYPFQHQHPSPELNLNP